MGRLRPGNLKELLKNKLSEKELSLLKRSYDVIGDIGILEIDKKLLKKKNIIADALLKINKNVKTVVRKKGGHEGKYRVQKYEILRGSKKLETVYRENGIAVRLDISKVYFSPRLSAERRRIADEIKNGENVLVMFSGVGVYCFVIAKSSSAKDVYGVEMNSKACKYAGESLKLNKLNNVKLFCGDVKKILPKLNKKFDRILMPLPKDAVKFLGLALKYVKKRGIIHFYCFSEEDKIKNLAGGISSRYKLKILRIIKCGQTSPRIYRWCLDFRAA